MNSHEAASLKTLVTKWVANNDDLRALALCGSWARGNPHPDSDLDLIVLAPSTAIATRAHLVATIPFASIGYEIQACRWATYGVVHSAHIALSPMIELELSFAALNWASTTPVDEGTRRVVADAFAILTDKDQALATLVAALKASPPQAR
jgi:hypothetical protein